MSLQRLPLYSMYGKPSMYHILHCIKCTLHIKKIFARMRVEPKLGVTYDTLYKMYIDRTRDCLYIRRVKNREETIRSTNGDVA